MIAPSSSDCDITKAEEVYEYIMIHRPDVVINSAAITDVDKCEEYPDSAFCINAMGAKNIACACRDFSVKMMHISTDYVFDGTKGDAYSESDAVNPINAYGRSKAMGEDLVKTSGAKYMIIRTAWVFGARRRHFVDYVADCINKGEEIIAVRDMVSSPTYSVGPGRDDKKNDPDKHLRHLPRRQQRLLLQGPDGRGDNEDNEKDNQGAGAQPEPVETPGYEAGFFRP